jgi:NAD-dependent SIR2 family protein deacetylase
MSDPAPIDTREQSPSDGKSSHALGLARHSVNALAEFVTQHPRLFVLTGAGISTESGIPGYRNADGQWQRSPPIFLQEFQANEAARRRYWARSMVGWRIVAGAKPNAAHRALARLDSEQRIELLLTQNVDGLHQRAGSRTVIELHGNLAQVVCIDCKAHHSREAIQSALEALNSRLGDVLATPAPDGDAIVEQDDLASFVVPECSHCGGTLKPDVVFFGEGVPRERVDAASAALAKADAMLVVGSSLAVYSGYRFCEWAFAAGKPIAAINLGRTRADNLLCLKIERSCAQALDSLIAALA